MSLLQNRFPNPGIFIFENDLSEIKNTQYNGVIHLVVGSSYNGPVNDAIIIKTVNDLNNTFGKDVNYFLERKKSYFHRTIAKMLETGPVYCVNLLKTDDDLDILPYKSYSCSSIMLNDKVNTMPYSDFYNKVTFWKKDPEHFLYEVNKRNISNDIQIMTITNIYKEPVTVFTFKSKVQGYDVTFNDWYKSKEIPTYINPKELVSDYLIDLIVVKGDYTDYVNLSKDNKFGKYFNNTGLRKEEVENFISDRYITNVLNITGSLIPYFNDSNGNDLFIQSLVNNISDRTGIYMSYDIERVEEYFNEGNIDLNGQNLLKEKRFYIDFLSYNDTLSSMKHYEQSRLDTSYNSWGDPNWFIGRTNLMSEGYIHNTYAKELIISNTPTQTLVPLEVYQDSYAIINGEKIDISSGISDTVKLDEIININEQLCVTIGINKDGLFIRYGISTDINSTLQKPTIDAINELAISYYRIVRNADNTYTTKLNPIILTTLDDYTGKYKENFLLYTYLYGWITAFRADGNTWEHEMISVEPSEWEYRNTLKFENCKNIIEGNYEQNRVYYLWNQLYNKLQVDESLILEMPDYDMFGTPVNGTGGAKLKLDKVEHYDDEEGNVYITIECKNKNRNITYNTNMKHGFIALYYNDPEFLLQDEMFISSSKLPYKKNYGGVIGKDTPLYNQYFQGLVNNGDRIFKLLDKIPTAIFTIKNNQNILFLKNYYYDEYKKGDKIFVPNSNKNSGIYTLLADPIKENNNSLSLILDKPIEYEENQELYIYDGNQELYLTFSIVDSELLVDISSDVNKGLDDLYSHVNSTIDKSYKLTIEIEQIINNNTILVDYEKYKDLVNVNDLIRIEDENTEFKKRNLGRVIEVFKFDNNNKYLCIKSDADIEVLKIDYSIPIQEESIIDETNVRYSEFYTEIQYTIEDWIYTYKGTLLNGFKIRKESMPDGTDTRLKYILSAMAPETGIFKGLSNVNNLTWRYLIDSYGIGFTPDVKENLAKSCEKHDSLGFINIPSIKDFTNNDSTSYTTDGVFDIDKVLSGGVKSNVLSKKFDIIRDDSSSNIAYFFPNVYIKDSDNVKRSIPPSAWTCNAFMYNKWNSNIQNRNQWIVAAGYLKGGVNDISKLEKVFSEEDLNKFNNYNINTFNKNLNNNYPYIYSNNTGYDKASSLSMINVREMLIDLKYETRELLEKYIHKFNTQIIHDEILRKLNAIYEKYKTNAGLYEYKNVISSPVGVDYLIIDSYIEPVIYMGRIELNINIYNVGGINEISFN